MKLRNKTKCITKEDLKNRSIRDILVELTDDDYNGNNGKEYYKTFNSDSTKMSMSQLDYKIALINGEHLESNVNNAELISRVLVDNYSNDYYEDYSVKALEYGDCIFVSVAYVED